MIEERGTEREGERDRETVCIKGLMIYGFAWLIHISAVHSVSVSITCFLLAFELMQLDVRVIERKMEVALASEKEERGISLCLLVCFCWSMVLQPGRSYDISNDERRSSKT